MLKPPPLPRVPGIALRKVPGLVGYAVGSNGDVWSCRRPSQRRRFPFKPWRRLRPTRSKHTGYWVVTLITPRGRRQFRVHCLVIQAFRGPPPPRQQCRHWNGDKDNNCLSNLIYGTAKQNCEDRTRHGVLTGNKGMAHPLHQLVDSDIRNIRKLRAAGWTYEALAKKHKRCMTLMWKIVNGKNWTHI